MDYELLSREVKVDTNVSNAAAESRSAVLSTLTGLPKDELAEDFKLNGNDSRVFSQTQAELKEQSRGSVNENIGLITEDEDLTDDEKIKLLREAYDFQPDIHTEIDNRFKDSTNGLTKYEQIQSSGAATINAIDVETKRNETIYRQQLAAELKAEADKVYPDNEYESLKDFSWHAISTMGQTARGLLSSALPTMGYEMVNTWNDMFPDEPLATTDYVFIGEITAKMKDKVSEAETYEEKIALVNKWKESVRKYGTFSSGLDPHAPLFQTLDIVEDEISGEDSSFTEIVNNIAGVMEAVTWTSILIGGGMMLATVGGGAAVLGAGLLTMGAVKLARKAAGQFRVNSIIESINANNPTMMASTGKEIAKNPSAAEALGTSGEEIVSLFMNRGDLHIPEQFFNYLTEQSNRIKFLDKYISENTHLAPIEYIADAEEALVKVLNRSHTHIHNRSIEEMEDGLSFTWSGYAGSSETSGFLTLSEATRHLKATKVGKTAEETKELLDNTHFVYRDKNGELKKITGTPDMEMEGNYFYSVGGNVKTPDLLSKSKAPVFKPEDIHKGWTYQTAEIGRDVNSLFAAPIARAINSAHHKTAGVGSQLRGVFKPFSSLNPISQNYIVKAIDKRMREGKPMTIKWMMEESGLTPKQQAGLFAYKTTLDSMHYLANGRYRRRLALDDYKWVFVPGKVNTIGKPLKSIEDVPFDKGIRHFYNHDTQTVEKLSKSDVETLYANGGSVVQTNSVMRSVDGKKESRYIITMPAGGDVNYFRDLPQQVLNYNPLYFRPQLHQNNIYITQTVTTTRDGKKHTYSKAVGGADTWDEAESIKRNLEIESIAKGDKVTYGMRYAKELNADEVDKAIDQIRESQGELFFSKRTVPTEGFNGYSSVRDNVDAITSGIDTLSNRLVKGDMIEGMKKTFMNTYAKEFKLKNYPTSVKDLQGNTQAQVMWRAIDNISSFNSSLINDSWRRIILGGARFLGEMPDQNFMTRLSQKDLIKLAQVNPEALAMSLGFNMAIRGAPVRQLALQSQQFLSMAPVVGVKRMPLIMPKVVGQSFEIVAHLTGQWSGLLKHSPETGKLIDELRLSGFLATMNQHAHADIGSNIAIKTREGFGAAANRSIHALAELPFTVGGVGFFSGEGFNRIGSWLESRERFYLTNKRYPNSRRDWDIVNADADIITQSLHKDNKFIWQKDSGKAVFQFLGIQAKSMTSVLWGKQFTPAEKLKLITWQSFVYGSQAFGLSPFVDDIASYVGIQMDEEDRVKAIGGLTDWMILNNLGEHLKASESLAAAGGPIQSIHNMYKGLFGKEGKNFLDIIPAVSMGSRVFDSFKMSKSIWDTNLDNDNVDYDNLTLEQLNEYMRPIADILSGFNMATKIRMYEKYDSAYTNAGIRMNIDLSDESRKIAAMFGLSPQAISDYYAVSKVNPGAFPSGESQIEHSAEVKELSKLYKKYILLYKDSVSMDKESKGRYKRDLAKNMYELNRSIYIAYPDRHDVIRGEMDNAIKGLPERTYEDLLEAVYEDISTGLEAKEDARQWAYWLSSKATTASEKGKADIIPKLVTMFTKLNEDLEED